MKCQICRMRAELICECSYTLLCPRHLGIHSNTPGKHKFESIDKSLSHRKLKALKQSSISTIKVLKKSKQDIHSFSQHLISKINKYSSSALEKLDKEIAFHLKLISLELFSSSLKKKAKKMLDSQIKIDKIQADIAPLIKKAFDQEVAYINKVPEARKKFDESIRVNSARYVNYNATCEPISKGYYGKRDYVERDYGKREEVKDQAVFSVGFTAVVNTRPDNGWPLFRKRNYLESLNISDYLKCFGPGKNFNIVNEISFSNDGKLAFVCKFYSVFTVKTVNNSLCCKNYSDSIWAYNLISKQKEWPQGITSFDELLKEASGYWKKYPECYYEHGSYKR